MSAAAAAMTTQITGEVIPSDKPGCIAMAVRQAAGVVVGIAPWNAPVILGGIFWKGGTRMGALAGLSAGFLVWTYTLLLPAFARGRAKEVILSLRAAQRDKLIPEFPIYIDGLVRTVCAAYASFPEALTPALRNLPVRAESSA